VKLLGIELSSAVGSIALYVDGEITERTIATPREQTSRTLECVDELLADAGLTVRALDGVAFGRGPGSFTGLRVAAAHAQGMAMALGLPLYPVSSLLALAQGASRATGAERAVACVDARMGELYCGVFAARDGVMAAVADEIIGSPDEVARFAEETLTAHGGATGPSMGGAGHVPAWAAVGDGFACAHGASALAPLAAHAAQQLFAATPSARDLFPQAISDHEAGRATPPFEALPAYLREATAWRRF